MSPAQVLEDPTQKALYALLEQGVLGAVCVLFVVAIVYITRALLKSHADRVADQKAYAGTLQGMNSQIQSHIIELNKTTQASQMATTNLEKSVDDLTDAVKDLQEEQVRLNANLKARRT